MRTHFKVLLLLILFANDALAQVYPVQGSATLMPPYALRLSDYTTSTSERFVLNALLADATKAELHVRFKLSIVGQNVRLETKPEYIGTPITLQGGIPLRLTNVELSEYFDVNHLNFSGISKSEFLKTGFLPEGFYQFCVEVYEYTRNVKISNAICAPAWLVLNDPPLVNLPRNGEKLRPLNAQAQNVIMQWTPRHTGSPNSAFTTEYEIKVVEVWPSSDGYRNPNDAILTQPPIFGTTTHNTTFIFGPDATQLELGRTYAFRVQARAMAGAEQLDLFKNNGFSETVSFVYGDACEAPVNILPKVDPTRIWLRWDTGPSQTAYAVRYRMKGQDDEHWYPTRTLVQELRINDLEPNTTYEYQIMSTCGSFESSYSDIATVTTPPPPAKLYECGKPMEKIDLTPTQIVPTLSVGDVVKAADFDVTITKASGSNGKFSGEGTVRIPFFNNAKARVKFNNITVAKVASGDKRMIEGHMDVVGPEVVPKGVMDVMDKLSDAMQIADSLFKKMQAVLDEYQEQIMITKSTIKEIRSDSDGGLVIVKSDGTQQKIEKKDMPAEGMAITDTNGNGYEVTKDGTVKKLTEAAPQAPSSPLQIDASTLDDFEKLVKSVIDSMYSLKATTRDSLAKAKDKKQEELDLSVSRMNSIRSSAENQELPEDAESVTELMARIELLDSLVEDKKAIIKTINGNLDLLNEALGKIKGFSIEIKKSRDYTKIQSVMERRRRISEYIENKLKK